MSTSPLLISVDSKVSPKDCGTPGSSYQVVNYSQVDTVWISDNASVKTNVGLPIQPQSAVTVGYSHLYAILDNAAASSVLIIVGANIQDWSPSPVKNVTISGPVTATITGSVDLNANVINVPSVIPESLLTLLVSGLFSGQIISNLDGYSAVIIPWVLSSTGGTFSDASILQVSGFPTANGSGQAVFNYNYYIQDTSGDDRVALTLGASGFTIIPLNGCKSLQYTFGPGHSPGDALAADAYGTNVQLLPSHRTNSPSGGAWLYNRGSRLAIPTGNTYHIPIPVTSNGVTIYMYSSGTGVGTPKTTVTITDQLSGILRSFVSLNVPISTELPPIVLPNSLPPQWIALQETGVAGTTSQWEILIQENALPVFP